MDEVRRVLPLSRSLLHLLLALQEGARHGYAVKKRVEALSGGVVKMGPGTLGAGAPPPGRGSVAAALL
jgi:DNA-binding PadR family transcriptional regulator